MILGIGVDIVEFGLFREVLNDASSSFKSRHFTEAERRYCENQPGHDPLHHYAGRYAAKEAFIKAGSTWYRGRPQEMNNADYLEVEVITHDLSGPEITLHGKIEGAFERAGAKKIFVSISHEQSFAVAMVVIEG